MKTTSHIKRCNINTLQKPAAGGANRQEVETLRNQVKSLEQQLSDSKMRFNRAEKPSEDILRQSSSANRASPHTNRSRIFCYKSCLYIRLLERNSNIC